MALRLAVVFVVLGLLGLVAGANHAMGQRPHEERWLRTFTPGPSPTQPTPDATLIAQCAFVEVHGRHVFVELRNVTGC